MRMHDPVREALAKTRWQQIQRPEIEDIRAEAGHLVKIMVAFQMWRSAFDDGVFREMHGQRQADGIGWEFVDPALEKLYHAAWAVSKPSEENNAR